MKYRISELNKTEFRHEKLSRLSVLPPNKIESFGDTIRYKCGDSSESICGVLDLTVTSKDSFVVTKKVNNNITYLKYSIKDGLERIEKSDTIYREGLLFVSEDSRGEELIVEILRENHAGILRIEDRVLKKYDDSLIYYDKLSNYIYVLDSLDQIIMITGLNEDLSPIEYKISRPEVYSSLPRSSRLNVTQTTNPEGIQDLKVHSVNLYLNGSYRTSLNLVRDSLNPTSPILVGSGSSVSLQSIKPRINLLCIIYSYPVEGTSELFIGRRKDGSVDIINIDSDIQVIDIYVPVGRQLGYNTDTSCPILMRKDNDIVTCYYEDDQLKTLSLNIQGAADLKIDQLSNNYRLRSIVREMLGRNSRFLVVRRDVGEREFYAITKDLEVFRSDVEGFITIDKVVIIINEFLVDSELRKIEEIL